MNKTKVRIKLSDIAIPSLDDQYRVGGTDQEQVNWIANKFRIEGQRTPIELTTNGKGKYKIAVGNHRYFAALQLGWTEIDAYVVSYVNQMLKEDRQFGENEDHVPGKKNSKATLEKYVRRMIYHHKRFGPEPTLADYNKICSWAFSKAKSFNKKTVRSVVKNLLAEAPPSDTSGGTVAYIKGTKQLMNAIKDAMDGDWDGNSVKSTSQGWIVQCISQDSDATIKPGTSLVQKYNTGAKSCAVFYVGEVEGKSDTNIDEYRIKWIKRVDSFSNHVEQSSDNKLKPFDRRVILPQKDSEIRAGVKRLEYQNGKLIPII